MSDLTERAPGSTVVMNFRTSVNGVPTALVGGTISVYKNSLTESVAGVTLTASYDSTTGLNHIVIDTSADGTFYAAGNDFSVVLTAGTVGGQSQAGAVVGSFSLGIAGSANLVQILATALTETVGGYLAAAFKKLFDIATPVFTSASVNQTGDSYPVANALGSTGATNLGKTTNAIGRGTVTTGASTTSIPTSAFAPAGAVADQFKGRVMLFDADTATTALRGQAATISASSNASAPVFTVSALTTAPSAGDVFSVI